MILDQIVADKLLELEARKHAFPISQLEKDASRQLLPLDFTSALRGEGVRLIAEVKRASPSKGLIRNNFDPVEIALTYADNGASAISVLTEARYFQGSISYLTEIKAALGNNKVPLLRKDFLTDPYQIYESRAYGADALLLIVAILDAGKLDELLGLSHQFKMSCLVEVHNEAELEIALNSRAKIIGINNRDLATFETDLTTTERLCSKIPKDRIIVSESGIKNRSDIERLAKCGVNTVLIGESLMAASDIGAKMEELL
ncbi:indole-3-glycerol phosphate synthase TrpC [Chloroflexota bacterium]